MEGKRVVVVLDASKDVNPRVFRWSLKGLSLKPGDKLTVVAVLYQFYTPMGYLSTLDSKSLVGANKKAVEMRAARRMEEYQNNEELLEISKLYESQKVEFRIELVTATSAKEVALDKAKELNATWVILDRQMKKDEKFFLQELSCGISRLKRNNRIEHLRGPPVLPTEIFISPVPGCHDDEDNSVEDPKIGQIKEDLPSMEEEMQRNSDKGDDFTFTDSNQTSQTKPDEPRTVVEETWKSIHDEGQHFRQATGGDLHIDGTKAELLSHDQEDKTDGKQEKSIFGNTECSICSVCKSRRPDSGWKKDFSYIELQVATDEFSINNSLSEGECGSTFKGQLDCQLKIVVKQHRLTDAQVEKQMMSQVQLILKARHKNVAMLLGSSIEESQLLAVYEYACNGSLDKHLSKNSCRPLSWGKRVKIAVGVSMGLKYLHDNNIIHGRIKPSNILLNHEFEPMLGDFSLGRAKCEAKKSHKDKSLVYAAPECLENWKLTAKTDVYSFGMVLLELITGQRATDKISGEKNLVEWAKPLLGTKKYPQLVDPAIGTSYEEEQLHWLAQVTEKCLKKNPKERLSMNMVVSELRGIIESEEGCVTVDFSPEISRSTCGISDITSTQGQKIPDELTEEKRIKSCHYGEMWNPELAIENNDMLCHKKADHLSHGVEKSVGKEKRTNHMVALTKVDTLDLDQGQSSFIKNETIMGQIAADRKGDLMNRHQGEVILDSSKSFLCSICKSRRSHVGNQRDFTYNELEAATDIFSFQNSLSEGGNGPIFRGILDCKLKIAIKMHRITSSREEEIFKSEAQLLTKAIHKNVVMLLGSCTDKNQQILVYEFACNGSLDQHLSGGSCRSLTWRERVKVAIGASRGLKYLHDINIIHGSIKPSNILLTHEFEPLLGDFGLGKGKLELKSHKDKNVSSEYTAPEYLEKGKLSTKTDVYSFGVVLLELISGRRATDKLSGGKSFVQWAKPLLGGKKYAQLVDTKISSSCKEDQLRWLIQVIEQCLRKNPKRRSSMNMVVSALQDIEDTDGLCAIEDSSPENSYIPPCAPDMTCSQGQTKVDQNSWKQEQIESIPYEMERSLRSIVRKNDLIGSRNVHQLRQDGEEISNDHMMCRTKTDQISQAQEGTGGSLQIEKRGTILTNMGSQIASENCNEELMQGSLRGDSLDGCNIRVMLEDSKSSVCSICKSKRPHFGGHKDFSYNELHVATEGFSIKNSLTEGVYGPSFRGQLNCKLKIVVKQLQMTSSQEEKIFKSEVQFLSKARHENVVMLLGSCIDKTKMLIVYENACNGSLDHHLSGQTGRLLTWRERVKIAIGFSRGLKYLHENNTIHGSIKPSNILITHVFEARVGDFGFGKSKNELKNWHKNKNVENIGYEAPELLDSGKFSTQTDVYSLGVVLLELITGHRVIDKVSGQKSLIEWAKPLLRGMNYPQLVDPKLSSSYDDQELFSLVQVIEKCLRKNPKERLTMNMVISALPCIVDNKPLVTEDPITVKPHFKRPLKDESISQDIKVSPQADNLEVIKVTEDPIIEKPQSNRLLLDESSSQDIEVSPQAANLEVIPVIKDPGKEKPRSGLTVQDESSGQELKGSQENNLSDVSQERQKNETCSRDNKVTNVYPENTEHMACAGSNGEPQETGRLGHKIHQVNQRRISYGGAKIFFLDGAKEYIVDEQFFRFGNFL